MATPIPSNITQHFGIIQTMARLRPVAKSQYRVTMDGLEAVYFTKFSGGDISRDVSYFPDGQIRQMFPVSGAVKIESVTLETPFDPEKHDDLVTQVENWFKTSRTDLTITVQPIVDGETEETPKGRPFIYSGCEITKFKGGDVDRGSADADMLVLEFAPSYRERGSLVDNSDGGEPLDTGDVTGIDSAQNN